MVDAFFLKFQMDKRKNAFSRGSRQGENWKKSSIFHRTVEMKQPYTITELFLWGSLWDGRGKKRPAVKGGKGGPSGAQAGVCLAWRLYASFGADIVHGALAFAPTLGGMGAGSICVRARRRHCVKDKV